MVALQREKITALEERNERLTRALEKARAAPVPEKRSADDEKKEKKPVKPRFCKICNDRITGFGCLKVECKAEQARRKEAQQK